MPARAALDRQFEKDGMTKTALITGATSGIGEAAARAFVGAGWRVIATGRRTERLQTLVASLGAERLHPAPFDVCDEAARDAALAALPDGFRDIDLLINNAGLALGRNPAQEADLAQWKTMIETNVTALASLTHKLLPGLIVRRGAIINVSSVAATYPYAGGNVYGATKAFVKQFSLGLRSDLHGLGVRVTSIEPGMAETEFMLVRTGGDKATSDALYRGVNPMTGDDIAAAMLWVAELPPHLNINRLEMMPVSQSFAGFQVARSN
jgi:serine 3-dehydrogenase (NADP+)